LVRAIGFEPIQA